MTEFRRMSSEHSKMGSVYTSKNKMDTIYIYTPKMTPYLKSEIHLKHPPFLASMLDLWGGVCFRLNDFGQLLNPHRGSSEMNQPEINTRWFQPI